MSVGQILRGVIHSDERYRLRALERSVPLPLQRCVFRLATHYDPLITAFRDANVIFVHIPKTGGTSLARALGLTGSGHVPISRYRATEPAFAADAFKFTIVRNPWDRLLSAYSYLARPGVEDRFRDGRWAKRYLREYPDFESFVLALEKHSVRDDVLDYIHFLPQVDWLTIHGRSGLAVDYVGRFERLNDVFATIAARTGRSGVLPVTRKSSHPPYREAYSDRMANIVADIYAADIGTFGYSF